jgi:protease II
VRRTLISDDHQYLAILSEECGNERACLMFKNLNTDSYLKVIFRTTLRKSAPFPSLLIAFQQLKITNVGSFIWFENSTVLLYTTLNSELHAEEVLDQIRER